MLMKLCCWKLKCEACGNAFGLFPKEYTAAFTAAAILQDNYSTLLFLEAKCPRLLELPDWNTLFEDKWTKSLCWYLVFMCKAKS